MLRGSVEMSYQFIGSGVKVSFDYLVFDDGNRVKRDTCEIFKWLWKHGDCQPAACVFNLLPCLGTLGASNSFELRVRTSEV
jgi:hypothetical protein